ncbi:MAG TPA: DUF86 domain-containing protein [Clostridia bacterium]|nr:DUF86 domain-containing protein [Clostridia bacterium]
MIDRTKLRDKMAFIENNLRLLREISKLPAEKFTTLTTDFHAAVRLLQISIEAMIDIGNHIVAQERLGVPKTYGEVFRLMADANVIPRSFLETTEKMVKFRNRVVHLYSDVDPMEVHNILCNNLDDFNVFIGFIVKRYFS